MQILDLVPITKDIRKLIIKSIASIGSGHVGGSLSIVEVLTVLYFREMNIDPNNPKMEGRDRLIVSKGHSGPGVYETLARRGYFPEEKLYTLNKIGTDLPSHCDMNKTVGVDMTTGSLGQGFSSAVGAALGSKIKNDGATIYCIIGDGESDEGQVWEAAMFASYAKLNNLVVFLDYNKMQIDGYVKDNKHPADVIRKWDSFGFYTQYVNGHDMKAIVQALDNVKAYRQEKGDKPNMIILDTVKGKGVSFAEKALVGSHSMPVTKELMEQALKELEEV
ncbi:MAG: transketolase [Acholeplasmataceae bacterium]|nr:transketolase [Acholeplasmataceae bacterium]